MNKSNNYQYKKQQSKLLSEKIVNDLKNKIDSSVRKEMQIVESNIRNEISNIILSEYKKNIANLKNEMIKIFGDNEISRLLLELILNGTIKEHSVKSKSSANQVILELSIAIANSLMRL